MSCHRCNGLVICERINLFDWWWRCVQCGDRIDRTILRNRAEHEMQLAEQRAVQDRDLKEWKTWLTSVPAISP